MTKAKFKTKILGQRRFQEKSFPQSCLEASSDTLFELLVWEVHFAKIYANDKSLKIFRKKPEL